MWLDRRWPRRHRSFEWVEERASADIVLVLRGDEPPTVAVNAVSTIFGSPLVRTLYSTVHVYSGADARSVVVAVEEWSEAMRFFTFTRVKQHHGLRQLKLGRTVAGRNGGGGGAHLAYIIDNYYTLPNFVLFARPTPLHNGGLFRARVKAMGANEASVRMYALGTVSACSCDDADTAVQVREMYAMATGQLCRPFTSYAGGEFLVSRLAIRQQSLLFYVKLRNESLLLHEVLESIWPVIFGCVTPSSGGVCN
jgi:hypothetical protein